MCVGRKQRYLEGLMPVLCTKELTIVAIMQVFREVMDQYVAPY
jgi:hypothetical protein